MVDWSAGSGGQRWVRLGRWVVGRHDPHARERACEHRPAHDAGAPLLLVLRAAEADRVGASEGAEGVRRFGAKYSKSTLEELWGGFTQVL